MRYLRECNLRHITKGLDEDTESALLGKLIELPDQQWQTIEEFDVEGWCWITVDGNVDMAYYAGGLFYYDDACDKTVYDTWPASTITHVQHIPKPEAPK